jgi:hypothetical protein
LKGLFADFLEMVPKEANMNRLIAMVLAAILTMSCVPYSWAEDESPKQEGPDGGSVAAAVVSDFIYIPGKVCVCATSGVLWTVVMAISAGTLYKEAGNFVHDACTGKWVLTGEDMASPDKE